MADAAEAPGRDLRCRQIGPTDLVALVDLLARGFPERRPDYWTRALERLGRRPTFPGLSRYGYLLEAGGRAYGAILTISSATGDPQHPFRCNLSSWYVEPAYRAYAAPLISMAARRKDVSYFNISPAPHTRPIVEAQGFRRYAVGQFLMLPHADRGGPASRIDAIGPGELADGLEERERLLVADHAEFGCMSVVCRAPDGAFPFVFAPRRIRRVLPSAHLLYARDPESLARFAGPLSRFLLRRGLPAVTVGGLRVPGAPGRFFQGTAPRYHKGPSAPPLLDLSYTEMALFGA